MSSFSTYQPGCEENKDPSVVKLKFSQFTLLKQEDADRNDDLCNLLFDKFKGPTLSRFSTHPLHLISITFFCFNNSLHLSERYLVTLKNMCFFEDKLLCYLAMFLGP